MTTGASSTRDMIQCEYCRGMVPAGERECIRCGAPLKDGQLPAPHTDLSLDDFVVTSHQKLTEAGTSAAELAFGVGCTLAVLVAGLLMVIIFFAFTRTWTTLVVILFILTLISILISSILANRAKEATTRKTFQREIKPEIEQFASLKGISQVEFFEQAAEILPTSSPLLAIGKEYTA
jgi:hypothetical protein